MMIIISKNSSGTSVSAPPGVKAGEIISKVDNFVFIKKGYSIYLTFNSICNSFFVAHNSLGAER